MNIIILGAGQVGSTLAENLSLRDNNNITLVDMDKSVLEVLQDRLDIKTIVGHASHPDVLEIANAAHADLILAVTDSDETNIVACQVAYSLYQVPQKIARVRHFSYLSHPELFSADNAPVDLLISPENVVTDFIFKLIELPGSQQVINFADGMVQVVAVKAHIGGLLVGHKIHELREHIPEIDTRIIAIFRHEHPILPTPETIIKEDDFIYFIATTKDISEVMREMRRKERPYKNIMIAGGGNIGMLLAKKLQKDFQVKLIESNPERAKVLSELLDNTIVLRGDAVDKELLLDENIDSTDVFIAVTNADEANILSSMSAKRFGAHKVMTLINRNSYIGLVDNSIIDVAISPKQVTISTLLSRVRTGKVVSAYTLHNTSSELLEIKVNENAVKLINKTIQEVKLPSGVAIVALIRQNEVLIAHKKVTIAINDCLIFSLINRDKSQAVEKLFGN